MLLSVISVVGWVGVSVMSAPVDALSQEEWLATFVRFVDWPVPPTDNILSVCQPLDAPPLLLQSVQVRGLTMRAVQVATPQDLSRCHVFSAFAMKESEWAPWLATLNKQPILVVGLGARFCELGGAICLVKADPSGLEKYQLNLDSLSRTGLRVRSQLLRSPRQRDPLVE
ncbi:MAG: YfiR family protein [Rhizobacter sp.]|nr:YfiR family protein [Burkholderiales bacterium]